MSLTIRPVATRRTLLVTGVAAAIAATLVLTALSAQAATLFSDNFSDGNADGWSKSGGSWSVLSDGVYQQSGTGSDAKAQAGSSWGNQTVQARVRPQAFTSGSNRFVGIVGRAQNMTNYYYLALSSSQVVLGRRLAGNYATLASAPASVSTGTWYTLRFEAAGSTLRGFLNGQLAVSATDVNLSTGRIGLAASYSSGSFDDVVVTDTPGPGPTATTSTSPPTASPTVPPTTTTTTTTTTTVTIPPQPGQADGFASVNAWGQNGTSGGAGGPSVTVDTASEFLGAIAQPGALNIQVSGMISLPGPMHDVSSDKSIIGIGSTSGITGGGFNVGLPISDVTTPPANAVHNVIIRNLVFRNAADDSINVQMFSHHVWIDHNDLAQGFDGLIDIKRGSSYVTVSWNHTHNHTKNMLLGHDDSNGAQDIGRLKVSYHHNWFDNTPQRNPRVRFGEPVHVYNNYYIHNTDVGVACQANAGCMVEGNYFESVEEPVTNHYAGPAGRCVARNNVFAGTEPGTPDCSGTVQEPNTYYSYTLDNPSNVKAIVMAGAGVGHI